MIEPCFGMDLTGACAVLSQGLAFEADAAPVAVQDWRRNLEILLVSQATGDEGCEAIHALGDGLHADGQLYPAHLCWIMAG